MSSRNIGIPGVIPPKAKECDDANCPFHGNTRIRGKIMIGEVLSKKTKNTVIIRRDYVHFVKKFQRYERRNSKLAAHLPKCMWNEIQVGDIVKLGESRKISKTKAFIVLTKIVSEAA